MKLGVITALFSDLSFNDMAIIGANAAAEKYGLEVQILQSITAADYLPNLRNFADTEEYLLIVAVGYLLGDAIDVVAQEYEEQMFGIIDFPNIWGHANVMGLIYREEQMSALVGCLAGMIAAHYDSDTVGIVFGLDIPILYHFLGILSGFLRLGIGNDQAEIERPSLYARCVTLERPGLAAVVGTIEGGLLGLDDGVDHAGIGWGDR